MDSLKITDQPQYREPVEKPFYPIEEPYFHPFLSMIPEWLNRARWLTYLTRGYSKDQSDTSMPIPYFFDYSEQSMRSWQKWGNVTLWGELDEIRSLDARFYRINQNDVLKSWFSQFSFFDHIYLRLGKIEGITLVRLTGFVAGKPVNNDFFEENVQKNLPQDWVSNQQFFRIALIIERMRSNEWVCQLPTNTMQRKGVLQTFSLLAAGPIGRSLLLMVDEILQKQQKKWKIRTSKLVKGSFFSGKEKIISLSSSNLHMGTSLNEEGCGFKYPMKGAARTVTLASYLIRLIHYELSNSGKRGTLYDYDCMMNTFFWDGAAYQTPLTFYSAFPSPAEQLVQIGFPNDPYPISPVEITAHNIAFEEGAFLPIGVSVEGAKDVVDQGSLVEFKPYLNGALAFNDLEIAMYKNDDEVMQKILQDMSQSKIYFNIAHIWKKIHAGVIEFEAFLKVLQIAEGLGKLNGQVFEKYIQLLKKYPFPKEQEKIDNYIHSFESALRRAREELEMLGVQMTGFFDDPCGLKLPDLDFAPGSDETVSHPVKRKAEGLGDELKNQQWDQPALLPNESAFENL